MPDRLDFGRDDRSDPRQDGLESTLSELGGALAWPRPAANFAVLVRSRIEAAPPAQEPAWRRWRRWAAAPSGGRPVRRSLLIAVTLLLIAATVAAAIGLGLPGIRILFGPPPSPSAPLPILSPGVGLPIGSSLGIGVAVPLDEAEALVGFEPRLPTAAGIGRPDESFVAAGGRLTLVWAARPGLPEIDQAPGIGLLMTEFRGTVDAGVFEKQVYEGATVREVRVGGQVGYWLTDAPHGLVYRDPSGAYVEESRRMVGDALIWRDGDLTLRLETSLGLEEAIRIAESIR
ncbi:MAG TPA: hypothetical protein VGQ58_06285 [Candidatus Limnocylindrales bacterium]|jgi:hypothetical protein|nr:hypothetical protein [Candidatus Limnocylindrales bacterium]